MNNKIEVVLHQFFHKLVSSQILEIIINSVKPRLSVEVFLF